MKKIFLIITLLIVAINLIGQSLWSPYQLENLSSKFTVTNTTACYVMCKSNQTMYYLPTGCIQGTILQSTTKQIIFSNGGVKATAYYDTYQGLSGTATIVSMDISKGNSASVTLTTSATLTITASTTTYGTLLVKQGGSGSYTLTLPTNSKVINGGAGAITLSTVVGYTDILTFFYDGNFYYWTYGLHYN
jgi:hypothetical protein